MTEYSSFVIEELVRKGENGAPAEGGAIDFSPSVSDTSF